MLVWVCTVTASQASAYGCFVAGVWEKREGDGGPNSSVITYASFETPKTGVGNVYLLP